MIQYKIRLLLSIEGALRADLLLPKCQQKQSGRLPATLRLLVGSRVPV